MSTVPNLAYRGFDSEKLIVEVGTHISHLIGDLDSKKEILTEAFSEGPYVVEREIARGGQARVWKGRIKEEDGVERDIAIKVARTRSPDSGVLLLHEAIVLSDLNDCDYIVKVLDYTRFEAKPGKFLPVVVVEYLHGDSLREISLHADVLGGSENVLELFEDTALALDYIHEKGYVHRDVKSGNIILTGYGHETKLCDFSYARKIGDNDFTPDEETLLDDPDTFIGTVGFVSPNSLRQETFEAKDDNWAFVASIYSIFSFGRAPIEGRFASQYKADCQTKPVQIEALVYNQKAVAKWGRPFCEKADIFFQDFLNTDMSQFKSAAEVLEYVKKSLL